MIVMEVERLSTVLGYNNSAIISTQYPSISINNKHKLVALQKSIEPVAAGFVRTGHIHGKHNPSDVMTKSLGLMDMYNLTAPFLYKRKDDDTS